MFIVLYLIFCGEKLLKIISQQPSLPCLPRLALVMNVISKVVRRRMQVQGYVHGQSKQLNLSVKDSTTVENAVSF